MGRQRRNPEKTRQAILAAAGEVLAEAGLAGFGVNAVAERSGFGKPLLYRYFGDRQDVLDALAQFKAEEVESKLANMKETPAGNLPGAVYEQILFARIMAGDPVLRAVYRAQLCGELGASAAAALDKIVPMSGNDGDEGAAEAFLMAGINYVLMLGDSQETCLGRPIEKPSDLAAFERAFVKLRQYK